MQSKEGVNVNVSDCEGATSLHQATKYGRTDLVKLLIDAGAQVNLITRHSGKPVNYYI